MNSKTKRKILEQILHSTEFNNADLFQKILKFLVDCEIQNHIPKESELAYTLFHKDKNYDPVNDATVRVYIYKLRLKLEKYYQNEGKDDEIKLSIPKGHYQVRFSDTIDVHHRAKKWVTPLRIGSYIVIGLLSVFALFKCPSVDFSEKLLSDNSIWYDFLESKAPILFVLGNHYVYELSAENDEVWHIKNDKVKSSDELENYLVKYPHLRDKIKKTNIGYLSKDVATGISLFLPIFVANSADYIIKYSSDIIIDDLHENEIVFIGSYSQLGRLGLIIKNIGIDCDLDRNEVSIKNQKTGQQDRYDIHFEQFGIRKDICIVAKLPLPNEHSIFMFVSLHTIGNEMTLKRFTDAEFLSEFDSNFQNHNSSRYFIALFEVRGIQRTGLSENLLYFCDIDPEDTFLAGPLSP
ncbi:hypothetical protein GF406_08670 [candidate division KSB1 bacterium]|nr:hypothetical protein [candidate division KSB1 bacterium]